jgi:hypothetical protein
VAAHREEIGRSEDAEKIIGGITCAVVAGVSPPPFRSCSSAPRPEYLDRRKWRRAEGGGRVKWPLELAGVLNNSRVLFM